MVRVRYQGMKSCVTTNSGRKSHVRASRQFPRKVYDIDVTDLTRVDMPEWIRALAAAGPFGAGDRRGTANLIDAAARARGAACISTGRSVSLARPLLRSGEHTSELQSPVKLVCR